MHNSALDTRAKALLRKSEEEAKARPSEAVLAACNLFLTITALKLERNTK